MKKREKGGNKRISSGNVWYLGFKKKKLVFKRYLSKKIRKKAKKTKLSLFFLFGFLLLFSMYLLSADTITEDLHLNIQAINSTGDIVTGTFDFDFNISTTSDCANVVYTNYTTLTTDSRGIISYYLPDVELEFDEQYWLCYYRDGALIETSQIARTPYSFTARNISAEGIKNDSNMNMEGYNITASWFKGLFNWVTGLFGTGSREKYLIWNGSTLGFNETVLNTSINFMSNLTINQRLNLTIAWYQNLSLNQVLNTTINKYFTGANATYPVQWNASILQYLNTGTNESYLTTYNATYDAYSGNASKNWTEDTYNTYDAKWSDTYNSTYAGYPSAWNSSILQYQIGMNSSQNISLNQVLNKTINRYFTGANTSYAVKWNASILQYLNTGTNASYLTTSNATYDAYTTNISINWTEVAYGLWGVQWYNHSLAVYNTWNSIWSSTYNSTYDSYATNVSTNWTKLTFDVYNSTWDESGWVSANFVPIGGTGNLSVNSSEYLGDYNLSYFMPFNKSVRGDFDFNGGWLNGGFSVSQGDIYAQTGYFYNISSLQVTKLSVNGTMLPYFDNQFDIGNSTYRWKNLHVSGNIYSNGTIYGSGAGIPGNEYWYNHTSAVYTNWNSIWSSTYNSTYHSYATNVSMNWTEVTFDVYNSTWDESGWATDTFVAKAGDTMTGALTMNIPTGIALNVSDLLYVNSTNVGIGTNNPIAMLEVDGDAIFADNDSTTVDILGGAEGSYLRLYQSSANWQVYNPNGTLIFGKVGGELDVMTIDTLGNVGIGTTTPSAKLDVEVSEGGAATIGSSLNTATGNYSIATGYKANASGNVSISMGSATIASGQYAIAMGRTAIASENYAIAIGTTSTASGTGSVALGYWNTASGDYATALGYETDSGGWATTALGYQTTASGNYATALGYQTKSRGNGALATGYKSSVYGAGSVATGYKMNVTADFSVGISLGTLANDFYLTQDNTMAIMGGNVGIGIVNPSYNLDVAGTSHFTGFLTTGAPIVYAGVTSLVTAPIDVPEVSTGGGGFAPMIRSRTLISGGYRKHVSIGTYRSGTAWNGGIYLAQGGNDNYPTEYFIFAQGGGITHSSGTIAFTNNVYAYYDVSALTFTDRTPYPNSLEDSYRALKSVEGKNGVLDKSKLSPILKSGEDGRDLSMTVSVLTEVVKDLNKRIEELEKKTN